MYRNESNVFFSHVPIKTEQKEEILRFQYEYTKYLEDPFMVLFKRLMTKYELVCKNL